MDDSPTIRVVYTPSGRFLTSELATSATILAVVAIVLATGLAGLTRLNGYAVGWIWIPVTGLLCLATRNGVGKSKCRHRGLGFGLGFLAGFIVLVGMYHIDQCSRWGIGWARLDRIPGFIAFRMQTDAWWAHVDEMPLVLPHPRQAGIDPWLGTPNAWNRHWLAFLGDIAFIVIFPACAAWARASRPFSEILNDWCTRDSVVLTPRSSAALRVALEGGTLAYWVEVGVEKTYRSKSHVCIAVWYCPRPSATQPGGSEVYLAIGKSRAQLLNAEQVAALSVVFPALETGPESTSTRFENLALAADALSSLGPHARLIRIASPHVGITRQKQVVWKGIAIAASLELLSLLYLFVGVGILCLVAWAVDEGGLPPVANDVCPFVVLTILLAGLIYTLQNPSQGFRARMRYLRRLITEEASRRPDQLFVLDDPRIIYAKVGPRRAWSRIASREQESDPGLLLVDTERFLLLFEGDRDRCVIPFRSIIRCELEEVTQFNDTDGLYAVVLLLCVVGGVYELTISPLDGITGANYTQKSETLYQMLLAFSEPACTTE